MTYSYTCPECSKKTERTCAVDDRDLQLCQCGGVLKRIFCNKVQVVIPDRFHTNRSDMEDYL